MADRATTQRRGLVALVGAVAIGTSLTLTQVGILVGIVTALLTFALNAWYTAKKNAREQRVADLEVREREVRIAQLAQALK